MADPSSGESRPPRNVFPIGSRSSALALRQTEIVACRMRALYPDCTFPIVSMETTGDRMQTMPLHGIQAKSLWTQDLEQTMLQGRCDMIVHSLKDIPTLLPANCQISAILQRTEARDAVVLRKGLFAISCLSELPVGSVVGTSSVRRTAQLARAFPHLRFADVRGNIGTRLKKLDDETLGYSCLILAAAGLLRLGLGDRISHHLGPPAMLHAVGQGALAIESRTDDVSVQQMVSCLNHRETRLACLAERSLLQTLEGGCSIPIGVSTAFDVLQKNLQMASVVVSLDGQNAVKCQDAAAVADDASAEAFGQKVAHKLISQGADRILANINALHRDRRSETEEQLPQPEIANDPS